MELSCEESSWTARTTAHSLPSDERITRILEPLSMVELSCAESAELLTLFRSSGVGFIPWALNPDHQLSWFSLMLSGVRLRHPYECYADRASERFNLIPILRSRLKPLVKALSPCRDRAPEGPNRSARPRIRVGKNCSRRLDSLQPTSSSMGANSRTHIQIFYPRDRSACPQGSCTTHTLVPRTP